METILNYVLEPYVLENRELVQNAPVDLFDDKGCLLLIKGEAITAKVLEFARNQQLYTLHASGDCQTDMFREVNLISVQYLIEACKAVNVILTEIAEDAVLAQEFQQLRLFDKCIYEHSMNVALLAYIIGKKMGLVPTKLKELTCGALLHDFGKLMISLDILNKPSHLTQEEYEIVKGHPDLGAKRLAKFNLPQAVLEGISKHHERWNGGGYSSGVCHDEIPLSAQIIAVADVFDAITANRPYRPGLPPYHALEMLIRGKGTDFSPAVVEAFSKMLKLYPENSWVTLNTGEVGTVTAVNMGYPTRPTVKLLFDKYGEHINGINEINLCKDKERFVCTIKYMGNPGIHILILDEQSEEVKKAICAREPARYICDAFTKAEQALDFCGRKLYDIIIAECKDVTAASLSILKELRKRNAIAKIIINIPEKNQHFIRLAMENGADAILAKPLDVPQLLEIIAKIRPAK